jgi:zinc finger HIT domain-containing protein 3
VVDAPTGPEPGLLGSPGTDEEIAPPQLPPLRALTSLNWPYVPDENAYPDPLKRDDPKALQLSQYEAIGVTSFLH